MKQVAFIEEARFAAGSASAGTKPRLTSGTLLTTPEAGALEFDGTSFYNTIDTTAGRSQSVNEAIFRLTADGSNLGSAIADYYGANSSFPTVTNGIYWMEFWMYYTKNTAGTIQYTLTNTQAYTSLQAVVYHTVAAGISAAGNVQSIGVTAQTTAASSLFTTPSLTTAVNHLAWIRCMVECGTAGNIRMRVTNSAGTITPLRNSFYTVRRLPAANVGTFVA